MLGTARFTMGAKISGRQMVLLFADSDLLRRLLAITRSSKLLCNRRWIQVVHQTYRKVLQCHDR